MSDCWSRRPPAPGYDIFYTLLIRKPQGAVDDYQSVIVYMVGQAPQSDGGRRSEREGYRLGVDAARSGAPTPPPKSSGNAEPIARSSRTSPTAGSGDARATHVGVQVGPTPESGGRPCITSAARHGSLAIVQVRAAVLRESPSPAPAAVPGTLPTPASTTTASPDARCPDPDPTPVPIPTIRTAASAYAGHRTLPANPRSTTGNVIPWTSDPTGSSQSEPLQDVFVASLVPNHACPTTAPFSTKMGGGESPKNTMENP